MDESKIKAESWSLRRQRIWLAVAAVPAGRCASYRRIAAQAGLPRGARQTARALKEAPERLNLPWHRIVRADRRIAFPAGSSAYREQVTRLAAEGVAVCNGKVEKQVFDPDRNLDRILWRI